MDLKMVLTWGIMLICWSKIAPRSRTASVGSIDALLGVMVGLRAWRVLIYCFGSTTSTSDLLSVIQILMSMRMIPKTEWLPKDRGRYLCDKCCVSFVITIKYHKNKLITSSLLKVNWHSIWSGCQQNKRSSILTAILNPLPPPHPHPLLFKFVFLLSYCWWLKIKYIKQHTRLDIHFAFAPAG